MVMGIWANKAIYLGQSTLYTEGDDKNINKAKIPHREIAINKSYL